MKFTEVFSQNVEILCFNTIADSYIQKCQLIEYISVGGRGVTESSHMVINLL